MQRLEVSGAVRLIYRSLGVKGLKLPPVLTISALDAGVLPWRPDRPTKGRETIKLRRVPSRGQRTAVPRREGGCEFPHLHAPGGPLCAAPGKEPGYA